MSEYKKLLAKKNHSKLELAVIYYGENPVDEAEVRDAEQAAAELARLQAIEAAARETVNTARSLAGSLTPDMPFAIREKILKLAAVLEREP